MKIFYCICLGLFGCSEFVSVFYENGQVDVRDVDAEVTMDMGLLRVIDALLRDQKISIDTQLMAIDTSIVLDQDVMIDMDPSLDMDLLPDMDLLMIDALLIEDMQPRLDDLDRDGVSAQNDCDDHNPNISPNAPEIFGDQIDQDCDSGVDIQDAHCEANIRLKLPNQPEAVIDVCTQWTVEYDYEYEINTSPEINRASIKLMGSIDPNFECHMTFHFSALTCGIDQVYEVSAVLAISGCPNIPDQYESTYTIDAGQGLIVSFSEINTGNLLGNLANQPVFTRLSGHFGTANDQGIRLINPENQEVQAYLYGAFTLSGSQPAHINSDHSLCQINPLLAPYDADMDGKAGKIYGDIDCLDTNAINQGMACYCGDGIIDDQEQCDDGLANRDVPNATCRSNCSPQRCGDGIIDDQEQCDDGLENSDLPNIGCRSNCLPQRCGDQIIDQNEACDDGNVINEDHCLNDCRLATCGDGIVQLDVEACDDGNRNNTDACLNNCQIARCGDGVLNELSESCDDANAIDSDGCNQNCQYPCGNNCPVIDMVYIPSGSFMMGSNSSIYSQPIHEVSIRNPFYVGKSEVTVGQYRACVNAGVCNSPNSCNWDNQPNWTPSPADRENQPITCVTWFDARIFAKWIGGDLLSEAQWEYVATNLGQNILYPWGNEQPTCELASYSGCSFSNACDKTGLTEQGVCDLGGNLREWVLDQVYGSYMNAPRDENAWCDDIGICDINTTDSRVLRGGSFIDGTASLNPRSRSSEIPTRKIGVIGFRIMRPIYSPMR